MRQWLPSLVIGIGLLSATAAGSDLQGQHQKADSHCRKGENLLGKGKWQNAVEEYRKAIKLDPDFVLAHYGLGQSMMALREYDSAVKAFTESRDAYYRVVRAKLSARLLISEKTRTVLEGNANAGLSSVGQRPLGQAYNDAYDNLARDLEQVARDLNAETLNPDPPAEIFLALAGAWFRQGNMAEAEKENRNAIKVKPDYGKAHNNLAVICMTDGRIREAQAEVALAEKSGFPVNSKFKEELARRAAPSE